MDPRSQIAKVLTADISETAKRKVLGENAARLLRTLTDPQPPRSRPQPGDELIDPPADRRGQHPVHPPRQVAPEDQHVQVGNDGRRQEDQAPTPDRAAVAPECARHAIQRVVEQRAADRRQRQEHVGIDRVTVPGRCHQIADPADDRIEHEGFGS